MKNTPTNADLQRKSHIKSIMDPIERGLASLTEECADPEEIKCIQGMGGYFRELKRIKKID